MTMTCQKTYKISPFDYFVMDLRSLEVIFQEAEKVQREGNKTKMSRAYDGHPRDRCNAVVKRTLNSTFFGPLL